MGCNINLNIIGFILNFIGTILIFLAYSIDKNEFVEGEKGMKPGEKWYSIYAKRPCFLKIGFVLLILGFSFMLLDY
jgi:TRAP-type mannitol/chloroaromatic compound transport system permease small subunit